MIAHVDIGQVKQEVTTCTHHHRYSVYAYLVVTLTLHLERWARSRPQLFDPWAPKALKTPSIKWQAGPSTYIGLRMGGSFALGTPGGRAVASAWWGTVRLYTDQTGANITRIVRMGEEKNDRGYSYGRRLTRMRVQDIIRDAVTARTRPLPVNPRGGMYLVLTAEDVHMEDFCEVCGFHYFTFPSIVGYTMPYAWVGNSSEPAYQAFGEGVGRHLRKLVGDHADHAVDTWVARWGFSGGRGVAWVQTLAPSFPTEIADLCLGIYGTGGGGAYTGQLMVDERNGGAYNVNGIGGRRFLVQWIWNPVLNYCTGPNALDQ
ncbi:protein EXORDIUM-like 3 [Asparagus officinalis]|uniref:protein EXORDIUM-like 3 n=1 Tax=Asparagus officinalis TaxID=4686 RepID=UPI00098DFA8A|nr:protein EXORDIUM-like 3 [Asparagus officinalis]